jgi:hypothetical protein
MPPIIGIIPGIMLPIMGIAAELVICPSLICCQKLASVSVASKNRMSLTCPRSNASQRCGRFFPPIYWRPSQLIEQTVVLLDAPQL